ncbi:MAG: DUF393 domain-containing protein [Chitinophagaceae bacterium]|nr:MAG: DUF393 domain-containing protein [Chitinophagaceae bacterium]
MDSSSRQALIIYDDSCALCNKFIFWLLKADKKGVFTYTSLDSDFTKKHVFTEKKPDIDSVIYWDGESVFYKSEVLFKVLKLLPFYWKWMYVFKLLPKSLRDKLYDFIAANRINWFGKAETCPMLPSEYRKRFK